MKELAPEAGTELVEIALYPSVIARLSEEPVRR